MYWVKKEKENSTVTDYYLEIIGDALSRDSRTVYSYDWKDIKPNRKRDIVVVCTATMALRAILLGYNYIFWSQGCWPEESKMRHDSIPRFKICSRIEKIALKNAKFVFFVSETMRTFYEKKYKISFNDRFYIMPCSNDVIHKEAFIDYKYDTNVFCYVGSTSAWQCFEETISIYSKIEQEIPNSKIILLVKEKEYALHILEKYKVKNYEIDFVSIADLPKRLSMVKYGFVIRKDSPVNYVATPTKFLTYLSAGVIPIYSDTLAGMDNILKDTKYKISYKNDNSIKDIVAFSNKLIRSDDVLKDYMGVYIKHYDRTLHTKMIRETLTSSLK